MPERGQSRLAFWSNGSAVDLFGNPVITPLESMGREITAVLGKDELGESTLQELRVTEQIQITLIATNLIFVT